MATVRMSKTLVDQIIKNFKEQCATAYADNNGVGDFVEDVWKSMHVGEFFEIVEEYQKYQKLIEYYIETYGDKNANHWQQNVKRPGFPFSVVSSVWFVVNPARPSTENRTHIEQWSIETYDNEPLERRNINEAINYVEGDQLINLPVLLSKTFINEYGNEHVGLPFHHASREDGIYGLHDDFRNRVTAAINPIVISLESDVERIRTVAAGTFKINQAVEDMDNYLSKLKTLKQFIDNWPGAENLVPDEYMQRHAKKTVRKKTAAEQIPDLPDELKSDVNAAILENKLVGDL